MSDIQIPNLPAGIALNGNELYEAVQAGTSVYVTTAQIAAYAASTFVTPSIGSVTGVSPIAANTVSGAVTISLATNGVTNSFLAQMAAGTLKGNLSGSTANATDVTPTAVLNTFGTTQGGVLYKSATSWAVSNAGTAGQLLTSNGTGSPPSFQTFTVSSGNIAPTGVTAGTYGSASSVPQFTVLASGQISAASNVTISIPYTQVTGLGTIVVQNSNNVTLTGGHIDDVEIGATTPARGWFTNLHAYDLTLLSPLQEIYGGTGYSSYTTGDLLYASSSTTLARLNDVATGNALISGGVGVPPSYGKIGLTTHVTGTLPVSNGGTGATTLTGYVYGNGTGAFTASTVIPTSALSANSITIGSTNIALGASSLTLAGLTSVTLTQDPTTALQVTTKQYVDGQIAIVSNTTFHTAAQAATTANLTATYNNGSGGVGATLTNAGTLAAFSVDGYNANLNDRILVKDMTTGAYNGIYVVTTVGSGSTNWVLTRATDFNTVGTGPNYIETGSAVFIQGGVFNGSTSWTMTTTGTITVGTTSLVWAQTSAAGNILVNAPLTKSGNTISLGTVGVSFGGTGLTSYTAYGLLYAPTTASIGQIGTGTSGYPLISGGSGAAPSFAQLSLTAGVTGILPTGNGGTGTSSTFTQGSVVFAGASGNYAQNNTKFFWDNTNNRLGINTASPQTQLTVVSNTQTTTPSGSLPAGTDIYVVGANAAITRITQDAYGTGSYPAYTGRQARGTAAAPTATQSGDFLAQYTGRGFGTTVFATASTGYFAISAAENFTDTAQGTYASIYTTTTGNNAAVEVFRFGPSGQLGIGGATYGTANYVLTSQGASSAPTWSQVSLTAGVTGVLPVANGGTGLSSTPTNGQIDIGNGTGFTRTTLTNGTGISITNGAGSITIANTGVTSVAASFTGGLISVGGSPVTTTGTLALTVAGTSGGIPYFSSSSTWASSAALAANAIVIGGGAGVAPSTTTTGTGVITAIGNAVNGSGGLITYAATALPSLATVGTITTGVWNGTTIATGYGGTGLTGFTAANNAIYSTSSSALTAGTLPIAAGGTGQTTANAALNALLPTQTGNTGYYLQTNGTNTSWAAIPASVTSFQTSLSGLSPGSSTTGAITLSGTLGGASGGTGVNNGSSTITIGGNVTFSGAYTFTGTLTANTSVTFPTSGTLATTANTVASFSAGTTGFTPNSATTGAVTLAGTLNVANGGTGATTLTGVLKGNGTSAFTAATAGTDYVAPGTATTFTATQTFNGSSSTLAEVLVNAAETTTVSATAATGTINFDVTTQSVLYYTSNASANWTVNFRGSSGTSLNTLLATNQTVTVVFLVTQGATAYYNSAVTIDGTSVTPKWQGGTAPTAGNASGIDIYTYTIIKTASATYTVFASQTQFK